MLGKRERERGIIIKMLGGERKRERKKRRREREDVLQTERKEKREIQIGREI